jgi:hypothetical protein
MGVPPQTILRHSAVKRKTAGGHALPPAAWHHLVGLVFHAVGLLVGRVAHRIGLRIERVLGRAAHGLAGGFHRIGLGIARFAHGLGLVLGRIFLLAVASCEAQPHRRDSGHHRCLVDRTHKVSPFCWFKKKGTAAKATVPCDAVRPYA